MTWLIQALLLTGALFIFLSLIAIYIATIHSIIQDKERGPVGIMVALGLTGLMQIVAAMYAIGIKVYFSP